MTNLLAGIFTGILIVAAVLLFLPIPGAKVLLLVAGIAMGVMARKFLW